MGRGWVAGSGLPHATPPCSALALGLFSEDAKTQSCVPNYLKCSDSLSHNHPITGSNFLLLKRKHLWLPALGVSSSVFPGAITASQASPWGPSLLFLSISSPHSCQSSHYSKGIKVKNREEEAFSP